MRIRKQQLNNAGFSLLEVLVAVAIMAIIILPILKSFSTSAIVNRNARTEENANTAAMAIAEEVKALSLEEQILGIDRFQKKYTQIQTPAETAEGIYKFHVANKTEDGTSFYEGVNGEEFYVEVTLDPTDYTNQYDEEGNPTNNELNNINSYDMPNFQDISTEDNYVLKDMLYKWDMDALGTFKMTVSTDGYDMSDTEQERLFIHNLQKNIKKTIQVTVTVGPKESIEDTATEAMFVQTVTGKVSYAYTGYETIVKEFQLQEYEFEVERKDGVYTVTNEDGVGLKDLYLFYKPYDIYSTSFAEGEGINKCLASDEICIICNYDNTKTGIEYENMDTYLVQQECLNEAGSEICLDKRNISLVVNGFSMSNAEFLSYGTVDLSQNAGTDGPVSTYSNIYGWESYKKTTAIRNNGITTNGVKSDKNYLYSITVKVWLDEASKGDTPIVSFVSTKEN